MYEKKEDRLAAFGIIIDFLVWCEYNQIYLTNAKEVSITVDPATLINKYVKDKEGK